MNEALRLHVQKITKLPTIPIVAQEILKIVGKEMASVDELEGIIQKDPPISAKILSVANSAFFGSKTPTTDIKSAIVRIGFDNVKNIALGISLMTVLDGGKGGAVDYTRIFEHSTVVGAAAKSLSRKLGNGVSEDMFINGMLHDIGLLIMNKYFPENYLRVLDLIQEKKSLLEAEESVFGFTHAEMGTWLVDKWNLPQTILDTTLYHHAPSRAKNNSRHAAALIHLADYIASKNIYSATKDDPNYPLDAASLDILGISGNDLEDIGTRIKSEIFV